MAAIGADVNNTKFLELTLSAREAKEYAQAMKKTSYTGDDAAQNVFSSYATALAKREKNGTQGEYTLGEHLAALHKKGNTAADEFYREAGLTVEGKDQAGQGTAKRLYKFNQDQEDGSSHLEISDIGQNGENNYTKLDQETDEDGRIVMEGQSKAGKGKEKEIYEHKSKASAKKAEDEQVALLSADEEKKLKAKLKKGDLLTDEETKRYDATLAKREKQAELAERAGVKGKKGSGSGSEGGDAPKVETWGETATRAGLFGMAARGLGVGKAQDQAKAAAGGASEGGSESGSTEDGSEISPSEKAKKHQYAEDLATARERYGETGGPGFFGKLIGRESVADVQKRRQGEIDHQARIKAAQGEYAADEIKGGRNADKDITPSERAARDDYAKRLVDAQENKPGAIARFFGADTEADVRKEHEAAITHRQLVAEGESDYDHPGSTPKAAAKTAAAPAVAPPAAAPAAPAVGLPANELMPNATPGEAALIERHRQEQLAMETSTGPAF